MVTQPAGGTHCPICLTEAGDPFHHVESAPTNSCNLMPSAAEARAHPTGALALVFCPGCGFVWNQTFDPETTEYSDRYEETQGYSPTFTAFHDDLARRLIRNHELLNKDVLEIGCGKGEFLALLARLGGNRAIGFDPVYVPGRHVNSPNITIHQEMFTEAHGDLEADLVVCKMTLEHVHEPRNLFEAIGTVARNRPETGLFILVPDATRILGSCAFEDIYYEHCSYFTPGPLTTLLGDFGFRVDAVDRVYGNQYLAVEARFYEEGSDEPAGAREDGFEEGFPSGLDKGAPGQGWPDDLPDAVAAFPERFLAKTTFWDREMRSHADAQRQAVLWGSGSKAVSFLSNVNHHGAVTRVVDINPYRQGHFMPGSGLPIVAPEDLSVSPPDTVVVMNPVYEPEINRTLEAMRLYPTVLTLGDEAGAR